MRVLLLGLSLAVPMVSQAAFTDCKYQEQACDAQGNHFYCVLYGWAVGEFCSATDVSHRPRDRFEDNCNPHCPPGYYCAVRWKVDQPFYCKR